VPTEPHSGPHMFIELVVKEAVFQQFSVHPSTFQLGTSTLRMSMSPSSPSTHRQGTTEGWRGRLHGR
jgi:hypothetical protein